MFAYQLGLLGDVAGIEIGNPQVEQDVEDVGKIEDGKIETIAFCAYRILYATVYAQNPERLDQNIGQDYPEKSREQILP